MDGGALRLTAGGGPSSGQCRPAPRSRHAQRALVFFVTLIQFLILNLINLKNTLAHLAHLAHSIQMTGHSFR